MKIFAPLLYAGLCLFSLHVTAMEYFTVNAENVNVRKGPGQQWRVMGKVAAGQLVLETRRAGQWSEVFFVQSEDRKVQGWVFNSYLTPQQLNDQDTAQPYELSVSALKPVCTDRTVVGIGSLCYLDVSFKVVFDDSSIRKVNIHCWADFVVPGDKSITPIQTSETQTYHLPGAQAEGVMRLNAGMQHRVDEGGLNLAYYNCNVK